MNQHKGRGAARRLAGLFLLLSLLSGTVLPWSARAEGLLRVARQRLAEGDPEEAARLAQQEAALHPEKGASWRLLGAIALQQGDRRQAEDALKRALRLDEKDGEAASLLAILWRREGRYGEAAKLLRLLGQEAEADQLDGFGGAVPFLQRGSEEIRLDWAGSYRRPVVSAVVAGKRRANFLVDTGASCVVLDRRLAAEVGLVSAGSAELLGAGDKSAYGKLGRLDSLQLGAAEVRNIPIVIIDLHRGENKGEPFDGILGTEFLQHFVVTLDYPRRRMLLQPLTRRGSGERRPEYAGSRNAGAPLSLTPGGLVAVPMEVTSQRRKLWVFLDTGATDPPLALSGRAASRLGLAPSGSKDRFVGVGGRYLAAPILLPEVRFAGVWARNVAGLIAPFPARIEQGEGLPLGGFLGGGFCRPFRVTIDFSRMRVRLARSKEEA